MIQMLHQRKFSFLAIFVAIMFFGGTASGQITYIWQGATNSPLSLAANWAPARTTPLADDILVFNNGLTQNVTVSNATVGRVVLSANTNITFDGEDNVVVLTISNPGLALDIQAGSTLTLRGYNIPGTQSLTIAFAGAGNIATIAGTLNLSAPPAAGDDFGNYNATNSTTTVSGTIVNNGGVVTSTAANLIFSATGAFVHAREGGSVPLATWDAASTLTVSGTVATAPANLAQAFGNFIWNNPAQTIAVTFAPISIGGALSVNAGTGSLLLSGSPINVGGDLSVSGGTLRISGPGIEANKEVNVLGNVDISGGTLLLSAATSGASTLNVTGNFSHTAGVISELGTTGTINFIGTTPQLFTSGTGSVLGTVNYRVISGAILQMAGATTKVEGNDFRILAGGKLGIRSADGITTAPTLLGNILTTTRLYNGTGIYEYNGTVAQNIGTGFPNNLTGSLIINSASTVTMDILRNFNNATLNLQSGVFAAGTNFTINGGNAFIVRSGGSMTGTIGGAGEYNITYTGASKSAGAELTFGFAPATRIRNMTVNLDAGAAVTFTQDAWIRQVLTLTSGNLNTSGTARLGLTSAATCPFGGTAVSHVDGPILREPGTVAFTYPVGDGGIYLPVAISGTTGPITSALPAGSSFQVQAFRANSKVTVGTALTAPLLSTSACIYWDISRLAGAGNVRVWLGIDQVDVCNAAPFLLSDLRVAHWEAPTPSWVSYGAIGTNLTFQNGASFMGSSIGISTFSPFTIGSVTAALPVELSNFSAARNGNDVKLSWTTQSERNNAYFDVQRSADGVGFSSIGKVNGAGNSSLAVNYNFTDNNPLAGRSYYRLRQVDYDEQFAYSPIVSVNGGESKALSVYPNPVADQMMVQYPKAFKGAGYRVIAMDGRVMKSGILQENSNQMIINTSSLNRGSYILVINNNGDQYQQKIQKQ